MITFQYVTLHLLLTVVLFISCNKIRKSNERKYWKLALFPIIAFTLEEGLRWGRDFDWCLYEKGVYQEYLDGQSTNHEWLFQLIWRSFAAVDAPYYLVITFCSFLFIFSLFCFFKNFKNYIHIALPLTALWCSITAINLIRWYMALSFLLIAFSFLVKNDIKKTLLFSFLACFNHLGVILVIPLYYFIYKKSDFILKPLTVISINILCTMFVNAVMFERFSVVFDWFSFIERFAAYKSDAVMWITNVRTGLEDISIVTMLRRQLPFYIVVWYLYSWTIKNKQQVWLYNLIATYVVFYSFAQNLELLIRYTLILIPFVSIGLVIVIKQVKNIRLRADFFVSFVFCFYFIISMIITFSNPMDSENKMRYVWNKKGDPAYILKTEYGSDW